MAKNEEGRLKVGDFAKVLDGNGFSERGDIVKIVADDRSNVPYGVAYLNGAYAGWYASGGVIKATENEVLAQFNVGDKVRLLSGGGKWPLNGYYNEEVYTITDVDSFSAPIGVLIEVSGGDVPKGCAKPSQLQKVIDENETTRLQVDDKVLVVHVDELEPIERKDNGLRVGDYARLKSAGIGLRGFKTGDIVELRYNEVGASDFKVKLLTGPIYGFTDAENLLPVSAEEVDEAKRWAAIARRPNEYKKGDIVRVIESPHALPAGTLFEVKAIEDESIRDHEGFFYDIRRKRVELVVPAEQRAADILEEGSDE